MLEAGAAGRLQIRQNFGSLLSYVCSVLRALSSIGDSKQKNNTTNVHLHKLWLPAV